MGARGPLGRGSPESAPTHGKLLKKLPPAPKSLDEAGRAEWSRAAEELGPKGRNALTEASVGLLEDLARLADDAAAFREIWKAEGMTVQGQGRQFAHPMIAAEREARQGILRLRRELGITPATVTRVSTGPAEEREKDEFDQ